MLLEPLRHLNAALMVEKIFSLTELDFLAKKIVPKHQRALTADPAETKSSTGGLDG
ncbi:MAG: hypothetical protein IJU79_04140 [Desulfovibrionaceae bacterium]|nr:hypothetical protein [Desulfovibrionaceae bacterium]